MGVYPLRPHTTSAWIQVSGLVSGMLAGLDIGRFHWSDLGFDFVMVGVVFAIAGAVLLDWAMTVNPYFEPTVRIQKERGHRVVTTGPTGS